MARVRLELRPVTDVAAPDRRVWSLVVDGEHCGTLEGVRIGDEVRLAVDVTDQAHEWGVVRSAIGRVLGLAPWGGDVSYVISTADDRLREAARETGFRPDDATAVGRDLWRRAAPRPRAAADDITRFLDRDGRIDRYPLRASERRALLEWVVQRAVPHGVVLDEAGINARLEAFAPGGDVAVLRRYLVDHEFVERTPSGSQYARVSG